MHLPEAMVALTGHKWPRWRRVEISHLQAEVTFLIQAQLVWFDGHFPQRPVLPGVAQLHMAIELGRRLLKLTGVFQAVEGLKFHRIIEPGAILKLTLTADDEGAKLLFDYRDNETIFSRGRVVFSPCH